MAKKTDEATTLNKVMEVTNNECGEGTMFTGAGLKKDPHRLPTGVFTVDYSTGGGMPIWGTTCFWGPESGGKTNLCLNTVKMAGITCWRCFNTLDHCTCSQKSVPMRTAWGDVEGTLDRDWAEQIGADPERYVVFLADYGEQYVNIADNVLKADDCGLLVIDSLAAMVPAAEMDAAAEDQFYALQARMIGRMVRNLKQRLIRERKRGHPCTIAFVNQMRMKMVTVGSPETMPGGHGMKHEFSLLLRCNKKALRKGPDDKYIDKKRSKDIAQRFTFSIRKEKVLTLAGVGEYIRAKEDTPEYNLQAGQVDDYSTVLTKGKDVSLITKDGSRGWYYGTKKTAKLENIKTMWRTKPSEYYRFQKEIIDRAKAKLCQ